MTAPAAAPPPGTLEQRLQLLVESVVDYGIFLLDPEGHVVSWNAGAQRLKGYTRDDILGRHFSTFYTPEAKAARWPQEELRLATLNGRFEDEGWRVRKDGTLFWANVVITRLNNPDGGIAGFAKITRDMSDRKRLEELERSSRRMNEFLAMLAHELRNPLAPMRNAVTMMQLETVASAALRNSRDVIDRQLTHLTRLVDDLLDVGRMSTGKITLRKETLVVSDVLARGIEAAQPLIATHRHRLTLEQPEHPVQLHADGTRLTQVLQNLLVNAAKYTPDGGQIAVRVQVDDRLVTISVRDNGRGLAPQDLNRIFDLFMQTGSPLSSPVEGGLGIGLTLARSLAEMHGGTLEGASPGLGLGSTFTLRLPVATEGDLVARSAAASADAGALRVLVVDDNRDAADSTAEVLRVLGNRVECAYSGDAAVPVGAKLCPDIVLLDLAMPGLDGYETRARLKAAGAADAFFVAMTGYGNEDDRRRTREAGFDAHVIKPVELDALMTLLRRARARAGRGE